MAAPGIWVELAGDEGPRMTCTTAGVEVEVAVWVDVTVGVPEKVAVGLFVKVLVGGTVPV